MEKHKERHLKKLGITKAGIKEIENHLRIELNKKSERIKKAVGK